MIGPQIILIVGILGLGIWSLKRLRDNFSMGLFYLIGMFLFIIQGLAGTYGLIFEWNYWPWYILVSKIASLTFNYLIAYFFYWLRKQEGPKTEVQPENILTPEEISAYLEK